MQFQFCSGIESITMPRPKNYTLRKFFVSNNLNDIICCNGSCGGKKMNKHAGNLERHLKTMHSNLYNTYIQKKRANKSNVHTENVEISCTINASYMEQAIVELFTKNGRPLQMIEDRSFKMISRPVFDALKIKLNEHSVMERIINFSTNMKNEITEECRGRLLSLKIDVATSKHLSVLGIHVQYIKNKLFTIQTLAIKQLTGSHTSEYLKSMILQVLSEYKMSTNQILTITIDNGTNMIKAVEDLNEDLKTSMDEENICSNSSQNSLESIEALFTSNSITINRCGSHTLQQCVNDVIKEEKIKEKIDKLRSTVKKLRSEIYVNILKNGGHKMPILDYITRWNSTYDMLERLYELKPLVDNFSEDNVDVLISNENWDFVLEFLAVFKVVLTATVKLQHEQLCYSDLYIIMMDTMIKVESLPPCAIKTLLLAALNRRKENLFDSNLFNTAIFLDPRIRVALTADQLRRAKKFIRSLYKRIASLKEDTSNNHIDPILKDEPQEEFIDTHFEPLLHVLDEPSTSAQAFNKPKTLNEYLDNLDPMSDTVNLPSIPKFETDLLIYDSQRRLALTENVLEFWNKQNNALTVIAEVVLAIPSTQVSVDRLFCALKYIVTDQRNEISPENLEHILLIRANGQFMYD